MSKAQEAGGGLAIGLRIGRTSPRHTTEPKSKFINLAIRKLQKALEINSHINDRFEFANFSYALLFRVIRYNKVYFATSIRDNKSPLSPCRM